jgi:hypothetical protein
MAAVFFLIANEIDKNPFLVFELRKVDLLQALKDSGYSESESASFAISAAATLQQLARTTLPDWQPDETLRAAVDFSNLPECQDSLLPLLSDKPVFYPEGNFKKELAAAYKYMAKGINPADSEITKAELNAFRKSEKPLLFLDASNGALISASLLDVHDQSVLAFNSMLELILFLKHLPEAEVAMSSPQIRGLHLAFRLADMLARKSAFVPQILQNRDGASYIRFIPARLNDDVRAVCEQVSALLTPGMLVYVDDEQEYEPTDADALNTLTALFLGWTSSQYQLQSREFNPRHFWFFTGKAEPFAR